MQESNVWCAVSFFLMAVIDIQLFVIYVLLKERQCRNKCDRNEFSDNVKTHSEE